MHYFNTIQEKRKELSILNNRKTDGFYFNINVFEIFHG